MMNSRDPSRCKAVVSKLKTRYWRRHLATLVTRNIGSTQSERRASHPSSRSCTLVSNISDLEACRLDWEPGEPCTNGVRIIAGVVHRGQPGRQQPEHGMLRREPRLTGLAQQFLRSVKHPRSSLRVVYVCDGVRQVSGHDGACKCHCFTIMTGKVWGFLICVLQGEETV